MAEDSDLFLFGDDLDGVVEALEASDLIDESFNEAVSEVQEDELLCTLCSKECKSLRGLKKHMTCIHKDDLEDRETERIEEEQCKLTADLLAKMVDEVKHRVINSKVFSKTIREELSAYSFTNLTEESVEFIELGKIYQLLTKKKNYEQFYTKFYSTVPLNSTRYFTGLSRNSATLLSTKLADIMLAYSKNKEVTTLRNLKYELTEKEMAGLPYGWGYVLHKLHNKHSKSNLCESKASQQSNALLKAGKEDNQTMQENLKLTSTLNRGGLWSITKRAQTIFMRTEKYFRYFTTDYPLTRIDINAMREFSM
ncbi:uncharacterized protein LOC111345954 [Stylophora pistillata]|uniref:C2H2-type domain-containing protein n=1 Tax=Stylophora pistillata TaxID=50429 RepID=A0A2B4R588_STYPI|nr:uncharacterized protein LOC111345954 [Stylophora pistillata]PFX13504.1 hypothetical protein AWC38_SpisGene22406 [Stylophora pistillata]